MNKANKSKKMASSAIICALVICALFLGGLIGIGTYAGPLLAIWMGLPILIFYSKKDYLSVYIASSILALLLVSDKELVLFYIGFGWYPVLKDKLDNLKPKLQSILLKLTIFTSITAIITASTFYILGIKDILEESRSFMIILFLLGAFVFFLADFSLNKMSLVISKKFKNLF